MKKGSTLSAEFLVLPVPARVALDGRGITLPEAPALALTGKQGASGDRVVLREAGNARRVAEVDRAQIRFLPADDAPADLRTWARQPEGYALVVDETGVRIWASQPAGRLYGAVTLRQLRRQCGRRLPGLRIGDAPKLAHRGVQLSFPQGHTAYRHAFMRDLVPELARWKINALYLYLESYFDFPSLPHMAGPGAMTPQEARDLDELCRSYGIALIPQLNVMAHSGELLSLQKYAHLAEHAPGQDHRMVSGFNLCATSPEVKRLVRGMLEDMFDAFSADLIHVGGDEVSVLGECPNCLKRKGKLDKLGLYLHYFDDIQKIARRRGRRIGIWGDMLLHYARPLPAPERKRVFAGLRDGTVIYDWHYSSGSPDTLAFFVEDGWDTIACSSTNLCYSAAMWPTQSENQRELFADAIRVGAMGGITTAWCNFTGLHEEQLNYLFASGATALWSGPTEKDLAPGLSTDRFEQAYCLQRYDLRTTTVTRYAHAIGDASGPVLSPLAPYHNANLRKCLYHTDNVLTFWQHYAHILQGGPLNKYRAGVAGARRLWRQVEREARTCDDPYLVLQEGPLLMHEHLLRRFDMTEALYRRYDQAARAQFADPRRCARLLNEVAGLLLRHVDDFPPIERYLATARRLVGLDRSSILRVRATRRKARELAAFLKHLAVAERPLPAFSQFSGMFFGVVRTDWYGDREHEWAEGPARFQRYTINGTAPWAPAPEAVKEPGPWVSVRDYDLTALIPWTAPLSELDYPRKHAFTPRVFSTAECHVHDDLFAGGQQGVVFFRVRFRCAEPMKLEIGLGYDGPVKAWLDRQAVFTDETGTNPAYPCKGRAPCDVRKGRHEIMVALSSNHGKAYGLSMQLTRLDTFAGGVRSVVLPSLIKHGGPQIVIAG
jgi:hypothetical protein